MPSFFSFIYSQIGATHFELRSFLVIMRSPQQGQTGRARLKHATVVRM